VDAGPGPAAVLLRSGGACCALEADEVAAQEAALLKPLPPAVRAAEGLLGAALLADGSVGLVLDPASTLERATLPSLARNA
jgi:chemotaxis protein histidine kinase CheA